MRMVLAPQCCFQLPPSLTSLASFSFFPQPYQIQLADQVTELPSGTSPGPPQNPKSGIQNLESKIQNSPIQNPKSKLFRPDFGDFGFWILDRYVAILYVRPPTPQILDFGGGFWILDFGFWILDFGFWISDFGFWILDFGFWISDFGFWISDFGFWSVM